MAGMLLLAYIIGPKVGMDMTEANKEQTDFVPNELLPPSACVSSHYANQ